MNILFLFLGDINDPISSSGTPYNLGKALREEFSRVTAASASLKGVRRWINLVKTFHPNISVWKERSYKNRYCFRSQSAKVQKVIKNRSEVDYILQSQTMFSPGMRLEELKLPFGIYIDYTIAKAQRDYPLWAPVKKRDYCWWFEQERRLFQHARHIFTFSKPVRDSVINDYDIPDTKIFCVRAGTPFTPVEKSPQRKEIKRFLFVGRDYYGKGAEYLLSAFCDLKKVHNDIHLTVIGCRLPKEYPGVVNIPFISDREQLQQIFLASDAFVLPSVAEPFGYVFLEAMACGLPCIGTNTGGIVDIIIDNETGFIVPPGNVEKLREKIEELILNPQLANSFGECGLRRVKQEFQWKVVVQKIKKIIKI
ncbi:MAG: glycosyltransferase family 4 protein [bacterium]